MARTAIAITTVSPYQAGTNLTATAGDAANDHQVDLSSAPKLVVLAVNSNAATVACTIELPAGKSSYNQAVSVAHTIPASAAGVDGVRCIVLDLPPDLAQSGNLLHIDSADGNFGDVSWYAFTWNTTPTR